MHLLFIRLRTSTHFSKVQQVQTMTEKPEETEETYTIRQGVELMLNPGEDQYFSGLVIDGGTVTPFAPGTVADYLQSWLLENVRMSPESYDASLGGASCPNPFNAKTADDLKFPRRAFYEVWRKDPHGLPCPKWLKDYWQADDANFLREGNTAPGPSASNAPSGDTPPGGLLAEGLTIEAVRGVLAAYPALIDVLSAAVEVMARPEGGLQAKDGKAIVANIDQRMKSRAKESGEQWGRAPDKSGGLSKEQTSVFGTLFELWSKGGRPQKNRAEKPSD